MLKLNRIVPRRFRNLFRAGRLFLRAQGYLGSSVLSVPAAGALPLDPENPLRRYAAALKAGPGIWKWDHYFDTYHRHFAKFRGREVRIVEIGVFGGGSLRMWEDYFGPRCHIYGIDIDPACSAYAGGPVKIFIGDQGDRDFWRRFKAEVPAVDIVIDDGSHFWEHQIVTCEEMLPHVAPGGVYLCEDIHGRLNNFSLYLNAYLQELNVADWRKRSPLPGEPENACSTNPLQRMVSSIHFYPFMAVIEKHDRPQAQLISSRYGSEFPSST
jgi:hypothetical protein